MDVFQCTSNIIKPTFMNYDIRGFIALLRRSAANKKIYHSEWRSKIPGFGLKGSVDNLFLSLLPIAGSLPIESIHSHIST
jgi:hypothetical protein